MAKTATTFSFIVVLALAGGRAQAAPFTLLAPGFTQELYATAPGFMGGVAFAPDGDVLVDQCFFSGGKLRRFDAQTTILMMSTTLHPLIATLPSNVGCGLTNHPDGTLYSNTDLGITNLSAETGEELRLPMGPPGNALGIAVDPITGHLVYVGQDCRLTGICHIFAVDPENGSSQPFAALPFDFVDGIAFSADGSRLFLATRLPSSQLTVLRRDGSIEREIPLLAEPHGIAVHSSGFLLTNNSDGTISRVDLHEGGAIVSLFATDGFPGDLTQAGSDGCLYVTQGGTRFDDGSETIDNSLVRICGGFVPPGGEVPPPPEGEPLDCTTATVSPSDIWPPNHKMVTVTITGVQDNQDTPAAITITAVTQDEPVNGTGDGDTCPDAKGLGTAAVKVRAERSGTRGVPGNGRVYHIAFHARGVSGEECDGEALVAVPHDRKPGHVSRDDGPLFDSTVCP